MDLVARARAIVVNPKQEWSVIEKETTSARDLYAGYIAPLAAIGPVARAVGISVFGLNLGFLGRWHVSPATAIGGAVVSYVFTLAGIWILSLVIDALAPQFGGQRTAAQALKVAAYSATPAWLAGVFALFPPFSILGLLGLYCFYLLYLGLPVLMKSPADKSVAYTAVVVIVAAVIFLMIGLVATTIFPYGRPVTLG